MKSTHVVGEAKRLIERDEFAKARDLLAPWLREHRSDAAAWAVLGAAEFGLGDLERARRAAEKVTLLRPDNAQDWCNLGTILRKSKLHDEAGEAQRHALELDPAYERAKAELTKLQPANDTQISEPITAEEPDPILEALSEADEVSPEMQRHTPTGLESLMKRSAREECSGRTEDPAWTIARGILIAVGILALLSFFLGMLLGSPDTW